MNTQEIYNQEKLAREQEHMTRERKAKTKAVGRQVAIWGSIVIVLGLIVWGMVFLVAHYESPSNAAAISIENSIAADDWVRGNRDASVILTEYSDLQCPACGYYSPIVNELVDELGDNMAFVYRHFPLPMHVHAKEMAVAAEAAGKQGKFFEMHDIIFNTQNEWSNKSNVRETVMEFAKTLGLNLATFEKDLDSKELAEKINAAVTEGNRIGISYTPSFFLNGELLPNPASYEAFKAEIVEKIAATKGVNQSSASSSNEKN